jgi:hypothetical protein
MDKDSGARLGRWHLLAGLLFALPVHAPAAAEDAPSISAMLKAGYDIVGDSENFFAKAGAATDMSNLILIGPRSNFARWPEF